MLEDWDEINTRLHNSLSRLGNLPPHTIRDCRRMAQPVLDLLRLADQERVICRRRRTPTARYTQLIEQAQEALTNFEGHVIMASLMRKDSR